MQKPVVGSDGVSAAARSLLDAGLSPAQVAYIFRDAVSDVVAGVGPDDDRIKDAIVNKSMSVHVGFSMVNDAGYCYLKLIKSVRRVDVANLLGKDPLVKTFMQLNRNDFDQVAMRTHAFERVPNRGYHVRLAADGEQTAMDVFLATEHSLRSSATPMFRAHSRHAAVVMPLDLQVSVGDGGVDHSQVMRDRFNHLSNVCGTMIASINTDKVIELVKSGMSVVVVCPFHIKSYATMLFDGCDIMTPEELRRSTLMWDVVVMAGAVATDVTAVKARFGMASRFAVIMVCYLVLDSCSVVVDVLRYMSTLETIGPGQDRVCGVTLRLFPQGLRTHTVLGGLLSGKYRSLERAAECSTGNVGECALTEVVPTSANTVIVTDGIGSFPQLTGLDNSHDGGVYDSVMLAVSATQGTDSVDISNAFLAFETTLYIYTGFGSGVSLSNYVHDVIAKNGAYINVVSESWHFGLMGPFVGPRDHDDDIGAFAVRAKRFHRILNLPESLPGLSNVNYVLDTDKNLHDTLTYTRIIHTSSSGVLHNMNDTTGTSLFTFAGQHRFLAVYPNLPVAVLSNGNYFFANEANPLIVQRGAVVGFCATHDGFSMLVVGMRDTGWVRTPQGRLLGGYSGCWTSGAETSLIGTRLPKMVSMVNNCARYVIDIAPGACTYDMRTVETCIVERVAGTSPMVVGGSFMTTEGTIVCVTRGVGRFENLGDEVVRVSLTVIEGGHESVDDNDYSDGIEECV